MDTDLGHLIVSGGTVVSVCGPPYGQHDDRGLAQRFIDRLILLEVTYAVLILPVRMVPLEVPEGYKSEVVASADDFVARDGRHVTQPSAIVVLRK